MSIQLIQHYHAQVEKIIRYGGSRNESALRKPFQDLLEAYAAGKNLLLVTEVEVRTRGGRRVVPDGTLKDALRQDWGYWESKDEKDDLTAEIAAKFAKGYPSTNILFEDTHTAVLYQHGEEVARARFAEAAALDAVLTRFVTYEPSEVTEFHRAIEQFNADVPALAEELRRIIDEQVAANARFKAALSEFLELCQTAINPRVELADAREMIIQHILTEDIFMTVFDEPQFHRENAIARKLQEVIGTFYHGATQRSIHDRIAPYYETINARAAQIYNHHEKQKFLKALYETFYRAYNPKAADRLGIVYTPEAIVRFQLHAVDHLLFQHFGKTLGDAGVEILDPATGTGTYITELIEYLPPAQLPYKYRAEIHCNEVAILPYYIANLNIEYTYKQRVGQYVPFDNLCFVDTLDNQGFEKSGEHQMDFLGMVDENTERIQRQNLRKISVIIGNPPYNAHQITENENNRNRSYPQIDARTKATYARYSSAQKMNYNDMYVRFYRWASDRLSENGVLCFVTNNSFIDGLGYDGFRKAVSTEFNEIWIVDLGGNVLKRETGNVFGIKVGVAIAFLIKNSSRNKGFQIFYTKLPFETAREKLFYLSSTMLGEIQFDRIIPDKNQNWINQTQNDFDQLLPILSQKGSRGIFDLYSNGTMSGRDEWVYDFSKRPLEKKILFFLDEYNHEVDRWLKYKRDNRYTDIKAEANPVVDHFLQERNVIKWSKMIKRDKLRKGKKGEFDRSKIRPVLYRPYVTQYLYFDYIPIDLKGQDDLLFPTPKSENKGVWLKTGSDWSFFALGAKCITTYLPQGGSTFCALYRYTADGERVDNITDWALEQFRARYGPPPGLPPFGTASEQGEEFALPPLSNASASRSTGEGRGGGQRAITKEAIFHYVYAVLHHPTYRDKYALNLKREFPRIPFYEDFWQWAAWGQQLMDLHLNYEQVQPYPLTREDRRGDLDGRPLDGRPGAGTSPAPTTPKPRLIARKESGVIEVDSVTTLRGVPPEAWAYRLGTYSAIEWVLERYKERTPKDPTIREKFNTYRFADYKEQVIDLLGRVCAVSVETMKIIAQMPQ